MSPNPSEIETGEEGARVFAAALLAVECALDWRLLGTEYCWEGGEEFFGAEDRDALRETGLLFAGDVAEALGAPDRIASGCSLYVGAAVAELAPILCEALVLERRVEAFALDGPETRELNRALEQASRTIGRELPRIQIGPLTGLDLDSIDHGWFVSVLTDPEAFPALHDRLYGRTGELATGRGDLLAEERTAHELLTAFVALLHPNFVLHTTDEELPMLATACAERGLEFRIHDQVRQSAIVGDPVRCCHSKRQPSRLSESSGFAR